MASLNSSPAVNHTMKQPKATMPTKQKSLRKGKTTEKRNKHSVNKSSDQPIPKQRTQHAPDISADTDDTDSGLEDEDELGVQDDGSSEGESEFSDSENHDRSGGNPSDHGSDDSGDDPSGDDHDDHDHDDGTFPMRKKKKVADDGRQTFATAFNAILGSKLKAYDRKDPILARNKAVAKELESSRLEARAKRALHNDKLALLNKSHVSELLPSAAEPEKVRAYLDKEKALKKIAQRGAVKLFNAVMSAQALASDDLDVDAAGPQKKNELMTEVTKLTFLDMVKAAGHES